MQKLVFTNGGGQTIDLTSGNFGITNWEGLSNTELNIQTQQVPFQDGGVFLDALMEQREISVTVAIQDNNDLSLRYELKRQLISALNPKLGEGVLVYTNDYLSRQIKAVPQLPIFENKNSNDAGTLKANITFSCPSPYWEDLEETVVNLSLSQIAVIENQGDVPAQVEIEMYGNAVNPKITNMTNGKKIEYQNQLDMPLYINTGIGVKEVSTEAISFEYDQFKGYIWGVYYVEEQNTFIALSEDCLLYSVDGNKWENHILNFGVYCCSMIYVPFLNKYIISCDNGKILVSDDLYNWEEVSVGSSAGILNTICCTQNLIIIAGIATNYSPIILTSTDGTTWTRQTSGVPTTTGEICSIVYSESKGLFIAVGGQGLILTSSDGETWTTQTSGISTYLYSVIYVSSLELFITTGANGVILTSSDGTTWTSRTSGVTVVLHNILENNSVIKIAGQGVVLTSTDGITWTTENVTEIEYIPYGFCYSDVASKYVITGQYGIIVSSEDGQEWERQDIGEYYILRGIVFAKGLYVAVGDNGVIITSQNKTDWTERESNVTSVISDIVYSEEKEIFVAVCTDGNVLKSSDGINWQIALTLTGTLDKIKWVKEKHYFIILRSGTSTDAIYITEDLNTYTSYSAPYSVLDVAYFPKGDFFVVVINTGSNNMSTTTDFVNYERHDSPYHNTPITSIVYANNLLVAVGRTSNATAFRTSIITSEDGKRWRPRVTSSIPGKNATKIIYSTTYEKFVVTGSAGLVLMSSDGIQWESFDTGVVTFLSDIIDHDLTLVFVGDSSIVLSSVTSAIENKIQYLSENSNIGFNLSIGENRIRLNKSSGSFSARLRFRQKYIGV